MNTFALEILRTDARLADTRHNLRVRAAEQETRENPPTWNINDVLPNGGVVIHHWLDNGSWWYRLRVFRVTRDVSEADMHGLVYGVAGDMKVAVECFIRNQATGGSRVIYTSQPMTQPHRATPTWAAQMQATIRFLNGQQSRPQPGHHNEQMAQLVKYLNRNCPKAKTGATDARLLAVA